MHVTLDPLATSFLLLLFLVMPCAEAAPLPLAATAVTVLAGDGFTLAVGLLLLGGVSSLRVTAAAAVCLTVAFTVAGPGDFAALRATPPEGWSAALMLLLVLAAAGAMSRVSPAIAGYLVLRVLFDLCGVGQPLWWGVPLLVAGAAIAAIGSLRAALADTLHTAVSAGSLHLFGMAAMALGVALFARAVDLPSVTSQSLDAAWLALVGNVLCRTLLLGCADATENGAGTRRLDRLGGLIHRCRSRPEMPGRAVRGGNAAARSRLCRFLAAVSVAARGGADRRNWSTGAGRLCCRAGRVVGRVGRPGHGAAFWCGLSRRPAHAPRRCCGRRPVSSPY